MHVTEPIKPQSLLTSLATARGFKTPEIKTVLLAAQLLVLFVQERVQSLIDCRDDSGSPTLSSLGFRFLLQDWATQLWRYCEALILLAQVKQ